MRLTFRILAILVLAAGWARGFGQETTTSEAAPVQVAPGVTYRHLARTTPQREPLSIHVLRVDRNQKEIAIRAVSVCPADRQCEMRRELPTKMAADASAASEDVIAVVNGDYDEGGLGISVGAAVTSGRLWTTKRDVEPALALLRSGEPVIGTPRISLELRRGPDRWQIDALNKTLDRTPGAVLYTREFPGSIKHAGRVRAVWIGDLSPGLPLQVDSTIRGRVISILEAMEELPIPAGTLVLAEKGDDPPGVISALRFGDEVLLNVHASIEVEGEFKDPVGDVIGGSPIIVRDGRRALNGPASASLRQRHPRTAACYNDRQIMFVVVDGRQPKLSVGLTLDDLSDLMISLGCEVAINTDGGGSSVMAVSLPPGGLRIVNSPSDGKERGRGNAWLVVRNKRR